MRNAIRVASVAAAFLSIVAGSAGAAPPRGPVALPPGMKKYDSPYYNVYTDVELDDAKEAVVRMTKMAEEYHERTKTLFRGTINEKLPFYLFSKADDYHAAGGMPGTAGVFMFDGSGARLMGIAAKTRGGKTSAFTWHTIQHEGFHQFVHYVVRGDIPTWVNEGMAEYFGEGIFTGDGMVTGVVPPRRCKLVKEMIQSGKLKSIRDMMLLTHENWNSEMSHENYDQAWSMCHFLAHGENGKYQDAFAAFMQDIGRGRPWEKAWEANFGSAAGFEGKWKEYWLNLPEDATRDLYTKAVVAILSSYLGRAHSQKQAFDGFDEYAKTVPTALKAAPTDWLPAALFEDAATAVGRMKTAGYTFALVPERNKQPTVVCTAADGRKWIGSFKLNGTRMAAIGAVTVDMPKEGSGGGVQGSVKKNAER